MKEEVVSVNVSAGEAAAGARPPGGLGSEALRAVLVVALANLALRSQPVLGLVAWFKSAALGEQIGEAADLVLQVDGNKIGARLGSDDFRFARCPSCFRFLGFSCGFAADASAGSRLTSGMGGLLVMEASLAMFVFLGDFGFAISGYSLHAPKFRNDWNC